MKNNVKLIIGHYIVFISYWLLEYLVFSRYYDERLSGIISHIYLYCIAAPIFIHIVKKKNKRKSKRKALKFNSYINIIIVQSGLSVVVLKLFSVAGKSNINMTLDVLDLFMLLLIAPMFEEYFYRNIILNSLEMGKLQAIIWSSCLFASVHVVSQGFKQVCYTMILGMIWGYLASNGMGLKSLVFLHIFSNFWSYVLPITIYNYSALGGKVFTIISGMVVPILAFAIMGCLIDKFKKYNKFAR